MEKENKNDKKKEEKDNSQNNSNQNGNKKTEKNKNKKEKNPETNENLNLNTDKSKSDNNMNLKEEKEIVTKIVKENPSKEELVFAIATYEDVKRIKAQKESNDAKNKSNKMEMILVNKSIKERENFIKLLNGFNKKVSIHEEFYGILLKLYFSNMKKQRKICIEFINHFLDYCKNIVVENSQNSGRVYNNKVKEKFKEMAALIKKVSNKMHVGLENTIGFIERLFEDLEYDISEKNLNLSDVKNIIDEKLSFFKEDRLDKIRDIIIKNGVNLIKPKDRILIFGLNSNFREMFRKAANNGTPFEIVYIFNKANEPDEGSKDRDLEFLSSLGISVTYSLIVNCSSIFGQITKVFLRAKSILSNGSFIGQIGNSLIANISNYFNIPVIVFCELFKFWDKIMLNDIKESNILLGKKEKNDKQLNKLNFNYDMTDSKLISMVVTEIGYIPPFSIKAVIREYVSEK